MHSTWCKPCCPPLVARPLCSATVVVQAMADLFALDRIYSDITFRNDDYIAPEKAKASPCCAVQLGPWHLLDLVEDELLAALDV